MAYALVSSDFFIFFILFLFWFFLFRILQKPKVQIYQSVLNRLQKKVGEDRTKKAGMIFQHLAYLNQKKVDFRYTIPNGTKTSMCLTFRISDSPIIWAAIKGIYGEGCVRTASVSLSGNTATLRVVVRWKIHNFWKGDGGGQVRNVQASKKLKIKIPTTWRSEVQEEFDCFPGQE